MDSPIAWLAKRTPPAPAELTAWLKISSEELDPEAEVRSLPQALVNAGLLHLDRAVARPGRDREAAHQLLAADALVTYGCEAASEADDVEGALAEVLVRVSGGRPAE
jgi:hypothetical protein